MKLNKYSILLMILGVFTLAIPLYLFNVNADQGTIYQIRILEISDNSTYYLKNQLKGQKNITIDTLQMKQFVAQRDELNGKYDAIYIGKGIYNTTTTTVFTTKDANKQSNAHQTTALLNDITNLKVKEITENYIDKGLPVILHKSILQQGMNESGKRNLYDAFQKYSTTANQKENVIFVDDNQLATLISEMKSSSAPILTMMQQRPKIAIDDSSTIKDYSTNPSYSYKAGDKLDFPFQTHHIQSYTNNRIRASLYFSIDKVLQPKDYNLVATANITTVGLNQISYTLPKAYSGLLYWRLEVSDQITGLKDYVTGSIHFKDEKTVVNILQIMPTGGTNSNLTTILEKSLLESGSYKLAITPITFDAFNTLNNNNPDTLNGLYDMLVFGFRDEYNKYGSLSNDSAKAVKKFIETGQSIMFTHDTIYTAPTDPDNKNWQTWINNFQMDTGQISPQTNLGLGNPLSSTSVSLVNDGLLTQYPYDLSKKPTSNDNALTVAKTHNQYFTLDLEDPTVVPWYNIAGGQRDVNDSWNHYYTYSKGNVTYSGTGHVNKGFPLWEKQLFVNTMHRAFIGANHAPKITVNTPTNNSVKPSYLKNFMLSYTVNDWDLKDRNLTTSVEVKYKLNGTNKSYFEIKDVPIRSGDTLSHSIDNPLPDGGELQIEISVKDAKGAQATEIINLTIEKATANLETHRTLSSNVVDNKVSRGEEVIISYSITPKDIPVSLVSNDEKALDEFVISDLKYKEKFPANLEVTEVKFADKTQEASVTKTGDIKSGITLEKTFKDITYKLSESKIVYTPNADQTLNFEIKVTPTEKGIYNLVDSSLEYRDFHSTLKEQEPTLGVAKDFSLFMLGDINLNWNNGFTSEGGIAAAGNIESSKGFTIGSKLSIQDDSLIAGGDLKLMSPGGGTVNGNAVYGGVFEKSDNVNIQGKVRQGTPINFSTTSVQLKYLSSALAKLSSTDTPIVNGDSLVLEGTKQSMNVFNIDGTMFNTAKELSIKAPRESTVIINVSGTKLTIPIWGIQLEGPITSDHILFNFHEADNAATLNMSSETRGSILAPWASITLNANTYGSVIGSTLMNQTDGGFHLHLVPFTGTLPSSIPTTDPTDDPNKPVELTRVVFPDVGFEAVVKVNKLTLQDTTMLVGERLTLIPTIEPEDASNTEFVWSSDKPDFVSVSSTGELVGHKPTEAESPVSITISSTDGTHISTTAKITVINPNLAISGPNQVLVNEQVNLLATYTTVRENVNSVEWKIKEPNPNSNAKITKVLQSPATPNEWNASFIADKSGFYTVVVTLISDRHPEGVTTEHKIEVKLKDVFINGAVDLNVGSTITLDATVEPIDAKLEEFVWSFQDGSTTSTYANFKVINNGKSIELTGIKAVDKITITVTAGGASDSHDVKISTLSGLQFAKIEPIEIDESLKLYESLWPIPRSFPLDLVKDQLQWSFDSGDENSTILELNTNGTVKGLKKGDEIIRVTYSRDPNVTATIRVIVKSKTIEPIDGDKY